MKWNQLSNLAQASMKQFLNLLMNFAKELAPNQINRFTNKLFSLNEYY